MPHPALRRELARRAGAAPADRCLSSRWLIVLACLLGLWTGVVYGADPLVRVHFQESVSTATAAEPAPLEKEVDGRIHVQAVDGGLLLEDRSGTMWPITASQSPRIEELGESYLPMTADELAATLSQEFGEGFAITRTPHYVICSNASPAYAEWCGKLFERLFFAFDKFWSDRLTGWAPPAQPLVAIIFSSQKEFEAYQQSDAAGQISGAQGYYSARTNRMVLYVLAGDLSGGKSADEEQIQRAASRNPAAISTVVHEAVHQLSFNAALQQRYADNPVWLSEGLAMYFEAPDLEARVGWRSIGKINPVRLDQYRTLAKNGPRDLRTLIATDDRFRDPQTAVDAYSESWALHFFLIRTQKEKYISYLKNIGEKPRMRWDKPEQRIADFETAFGPIEKLERDQRKYILKLRGGR